MKTSEGEAMRQLLDGYIDLILQTVSNCRGGGEGRDGRRGEGRGGERRGEGEERGGGRRGEGREVMGREDRGGKRMGGKRGLRSNWEEIPHSTNSQ